MTDLLRASRAGDRFHYRWAARRCLKLLDQQCGLLKVYIENSSDSEQDGEESIDVSEYYSDGRVILCQLKHTTTRSESSFSFSEIEKTIGDFAARFKKDEGVQFLFVSNRTVSEEVTSGIQRLATDPSSDHSGAKKIRSKTQLEGKKLQKFCKNFSFNDREENFHIQKLRLSAEAGVFVAGRVDREEIANLVDLVAEKAEPGNEDSPINQAHLSSYGVRQHYVTFKGDEFIDLGCLERDIDVSPMDHGELEFEISREFKPADPKVFSGG